MKKHLFILLLMVSFISLVGCEKTPTITSKTDLEILEEAKENLSVPLRTNTNLTFKTKLENNVVVTWKSNNEKYLNDEGVVNRPTFEEGNVVVEVTATLRLNNESIKKKFVIEIIALEEEINEEDYTLEQGYNSEYRVTLEDIDNLQSSLPEYIYEGPKINFMHDYKKAGLFYENMEQKLFSNKVSVEGVTYDVLDFGATPNDSTFDNTPIIETLMSIVNEGDTIYFPEGRYYFKTDVGGSVFYTPAIQVTKNNISIIGDGPNKTFIVNAYSENLNLTPRSTTLLIRDAKNVLIQGIAFTNDFDDKLLPEPGNTSVNNPEANKHVPQFHVVIYGEKSLTEHNILDDLVIEYFQYSGIRIHNASSNVVINTLVHKSTDIGGGGSGYGIEIRGQGHERFEYIKSEFDTHFNVIGNVRIIGDHIRHGIIFSYMAHNNLVFNNYVTNTGDDGIDLHGQDEFLNYLYNNISTNSYRGAGIGLGNYGNASNKHDESGVGNVLYKNVLSNNRYGITIQYETFYTQVIKNVMENNRDGAIVEHNEVKYTNIQDNEYLNNVDKRVTNPRPATWK